MCLSFNLKCNILMWNKQVWLKIMLAFTTAWKVSKYGLFSGPYFLVFRLNTEIYEVNLLIQSKYRKIQTRKNSIFGHFSRHNCLSCRSISSLINPFHATRNFLYQMKTSENQMFFNFFRGYSEISVAWNELTICWNLLFLISYLHGCSIFY